MAQRTGSFISGTSGNLTGNTSQTGTSGTGISERSAAASSSKTPKFVDAPVLVPSGPHDKPEKYWEMLLSAPGMKLGQYVWTLTLRKETIGPCENPAPGFAPASEEYSCELHLSYDLYRDGAVYTSKPFMMSEFIKNMDSPEGSAVLDKVGGSLNYKASVARQVTDFAITELICPSASSGRRQNFRVYPRS
jgi:hypothetical protein